MIDFRESLNHEREIRTLFEPFIIEAVTRLCKAHSLTFQSLATGSEADDANGVDAWLRVQERLQPIAIDLKISNQSSWRIPLEWRSGRNQYAKPWAIAAKCDLYFWVNPKHSQAYYADARLLATKLTSSMTDLDRDLLVTCEYSSVSTVNGQTFESLVSLCTPELFCRLTKGFGGAV